MAVRKIKHENINIDKESRFKKEAAEKVAQAWKVITDAIDNVIDTVALVVDEIKEKFHCPVSRRYKFVKIIGAMGYDKQRVWTMTRHTWLARSNC